MLATTTQTWRPPDTNRCTNPPNRALRTSSALLQTNCGISADSLCTDCHVFVAVLGYAATWCRTKDTTFRDSFRIPSSCLNVVRKIRRFGIAFWFVLHVWWKRILPTVLRPVVTPKKLQRQFYRDESLGSQISMYSVTQSMLLCMFCGCSVTRWSWSRYIETCRSCDGLRVRSIMHIMQNGIHIH